MATVTSDLLTREEAAEYLGLKPQTLSVWHSTGRYSVPLVKVGTKVRYRKSDLDKWIQSRTQTSSSSED